MQFKIRGELTVKKLELLARIDKLSSILHSHDLAQFNLTETSIDEMRQSLDELSDKYLAKYCPAAY
jgi:hypothetical protein